MTLALKQSHTIRTPHIVATAVLLAVSMAANSAIAQGYNRIKTEEAFRKLVVGKILTGERGWAKFLADGSMAGSFNGKKLRGAWAWRRNFLCRNVRLGNDPELGTDCQVIKVSGSKLRLTRNKGRGQVVNYILE